MSDMRLTITPKSEQINFDDLLGGQTKTIKITGVKIVSGDQPVSLFFEGDDDKPYKPGKTMRRLLVLVWGNDANAYVGRSLTLYGDPKVRFGGQEVGGLRISHMSGLSEPSTFMLTETRGKKKPYTVQPLAGATPTPEDKATQEAFDALLQEAYGATSLEGINDIAKKATPLSRGVMKSKINEMKEVVTKKRAEFQRQPGEDG